jgi:subfamily B ATP-binding cassette protein MsbA
MISKYGNNFLGYFQYYYSIVGRKLLFSICLSIVVSALDGLGLAMFMPLLQSVANEGQEAKESMGNLHYIIDAIKEMGFPLTLGTILATMVILFSFKGFVRYVEVNYTAGVVYFFMKKLRHKLVNKLQNISFRGFTKLEAGNIQNNFIAEAQKMSQAVKSYLLYCQALIMLITYVSFSLLANFQFALLLAVSAGLTNLLYSRIYKKLKETSYKISESGNNFNAYMLQAVHYFKYLKATSYLSIYSKKLKEVIDTTEALSKKTAKYNSITMGLKEPMIILIVVIVVYVQSTWMGSNLGSIILSLILFYRALNFLVVLQQYWQNFIQNNGSLRSISKIEKTMSKMVEVQGTKEFDTLKKDIAVVDASLTYGKNTVLQKTNIIIPQKQTVAFVGESGSGKTSLANIIMGLINPDKGAVFLDGTPLTEYNLDSYRKKIGYISQDPVIFNDSIFNNVTFWAEPTPDNMKRFWEVIEMVSLNEFVESHEEKEMTKLGDHGLLISGGQKQRISIAREMFKNVISKPSSPV